jgi:hypothetical protein
MGLLLTYLLNISAIFEWCIMQSCLIENLVIKDNQKPNKIVKNK